MAAIIVAPATIPATGPVTADTMWITNLSIVGTNPNAPVNVTCTMRQFGRDSNGIAVFTNNPPVVISQRDVLGAANFATPKLANLEALLVDATTAEKLALAFDTITAAVEALALDKHLITAPPAAPTVTAVSPTTISTTGGAAMTITGTGFTGTTAVHFGSAAATAVTVVSATQITCISPANAAGATDVTVTTPAGTSATSSADQVTYA